MTTALAQVPALIPKLYEPGIRDAFYSNVSMFKEWPPTPGVEGGVERWPMGTDGTDNSRATSEGGTIPSSNIDEAIDLELTQQPYEVVAELTHETMADARRDGIDPWLWSLMRQTKYLIAKVNTTLLAEFEAALIATGNYAGKTRTSYSSALVSYLEATVTALTYDYLATMMRTLLDSKNNEYGDLALYLSPTGLFRYAKVAHLSTPVARVVHSSSEQKTDAGLVYTINGEPPSFEGLPIHVMAGMTATTFIMGPGLVPGEVKNAEAKQPDGSSGLKIWPLAKVRRTERALIDGRWKNRVKQPALWGQLTGKS